MKKDCFLNANVIATEFVFQQHCAFRSVEYDKRICQHYAVRGKLPSTGYRIFKIMLPATDERELSIEDYSSGYIYPAAMLVADLIANTMPKDKMLLFGKVLILDHETAVRVTGISNGITVKCKDLGAEFEVSIAVLDKLDIKVEVEQR